MGSFYEAERHIESRDYPAPDSQIPVSILVLLSSVIVFVMRLEKGVMLQSLSVLTPVCLMVFLALGAPQIQRFKRIEERLIQDGAAKTGNLFGSGTRLILLVSFFVVTILGPFLLSSVLPTELWIGGVLGMIIGFSLSQLSFILYVKSWEKKNGFNVEGYTVWVYDEENRVRVTERGVRRRVD